MKKVVVFCFFFLNILVVSAANNKFSVTLNKCVDGDTAKFVIDGEVKTVRFLSINTPELAHYGNAAEAYGVEASDYTCNMLTNASSIKLQYDPNSDNTDKYDRVLAWVFVDNELLQEKLISEGLAEVKYVYGDYLYTSLLQELEIKAQENKIGMWANESSVITEVDDDSNHELIIYTIAIIAVVIVAIFGKSTSKKKKAISKIKKLTKI